ncbi:MAG: hypothetical protein CR982_01350 [Candidatus Cloacimonadota bacterium]|nr:MAG: hypothetical protein CR982_01350 [Candidatus Cloacimonadota bacterium]PIE79841.1 MAG: hypothetical protein CSA15_02565 [Candidatus Delongbacteria bacterium]
MFKRYKGGILFIVIVIVMILALTATGLFYSVRANIIDVKSKNEDFKLFWGAQAAQSYGEIYLKNLRVSKFEGSSISTPNVKPYALINGCDYVTLNFVKDSVGSWKIEAKSALNGRDTEIEVDGIRSQTLLKYAECINTLGTGDGRWGTGYKFWGNVFVNDILKIGGFPEFYSTVDVRGGFFNSTTATNGYSFPLALKKGIKDFYNNRKDEDWDTIFQGTFNGSHPGATLPDAAYDWDEINADTNIKKLTIDKTVDRSKLMFDFVVDGGVQKLKVYKQNNQLLNTYDLTNYDAVMVDDKDNSMYVGVKGEINKEISFVTKTASIHIAGDLYYSSIKDLVDGTNKITSSEYYANPSFYVGTSSDDLAKTDNIHSILSSNVTEFCGLLAGVGLTSKPPATERDKGKLLIDKNSDTDNETPLFVTAGIYSPWGEISADNVTNYFGATYSPPDWDPTYNGVPFIAFGSLISDEEGWTSGSSNVSDIGILMNPVNDLRFKNGLAPRTYKIMVYGDGTTSFSVNKWVVK